MPQRRSTAPKTRRPKAKAPSRRRPGTGNKRKNAKSSINKVRDFGYVGLKFIGHVNAGLSGDVGKMATRALRVFGGKKAGEMLGSKMFKID
jgi:hypothetical protein